jgi:hypothetical protein
VLHGRGSGASVAPAGRRRSSPLGRPQASAANARLVRASRRSDGRKRGGRCRRQDR